MAPTHHADTQYAGTARLTGVLLLTALTAMIAGAVIVVPSGLTLNPAEPAAALAAVEARPGLHLIELGLDVIGWLALTGAALTMAARTVATGSHLALLPAGLLACTGLSGLLHDAGNLALTQLAAAPAGPTTVAVAKAVLLTAKWTVNLAGVLGSSHHHYRALGSHDGPAAALEQLGYALHLPIMIWYGALGWRDLRARPAAGH